MALAVTAARTARADQPVPPTPTAPPASLVPAPSPSPSLVGAMSEDARAHYERGLALYTAKDYTGAIRELEAGYTIEPRREFLFAEAQARRLDGDCKNAVPLYRRFLASEPEDVQANAAHIALGRCAEQMASAPPPVAARPAQRAAPPPPPAPRPPPPPPAPWYQDGVGAALLGAGVVGLVTGSVYTVAARAARDDANQAAPTYPDYARLWDTARSRSQIAIAGFAAGATLASAAIVRYLRVRGRHGATAAAPTFDAWVTPNPGGHDGKGGGFAGASAGLGGRF